MTPLDHNRTDMPFSGKLSVLFLLGVGLQEMVARTNFMNLEFQKRKIVQNDIPKVKGFRQMHGWMGKIVN